ncbi:MAG: hypothetical protein MJY93_05625 [Fibrobacter sp.]|nr:hypothetical protein [archaeon]MCQ2089709.1 hypothetical protein [Fibrobacter sp.]
MADKHLPISQTSHKNGKVYFCRFRRVKNSNRMLDAWDYGLKAWAIPLR